MLFDIIFYCYFVMVLLLVLFLVQYVLIAVLQLYGYIFKSFVKFRLNYISKNILWYFFIVLLATFLSVVCDNYYQKFNVVLLVISGCILSVFYINQIRFFTGHADSHSG